MDTIFSFIKSFITIMADAFSQANAVRDVILFILSVCVFHNVVYTVLGFFFTRKFKAAQKQHKYAIVIAARNEESVIGNLLDSIKKQDYPQDLLTVFVVADNCTDNTADVARQKGAICYERFDPDHRTKGFALQFLFENIRKDYGIDFFEGYFVFDADNLLNSDYITRMNEAFDEGEKIITSYRNTKNFDENWVAFTYAIHWLRSIRFRHRARSVLRLATNIQGTGFLFANELVKNGWNYTSLTEDRAFTADAVAHGYAISYCDAAMFYDEQPTSLRVAIRQRLRWSKGHLMAFTETGPALFKNIFVGNCYRDKSVKTPFSRKKLIEGIRSRWASFDTLVQVFPLAVVKAVTWLIVPLFMFSCYNYAYGTNSADLFLVTTPLGKLLSLMFGDVKVDITPGILAMVSSLGLAVLWNVIKRLQFHFANMLTSFYVLVVERGKIIKIPLYKKILYSLTWPSFDLIGRWTTYFALFMKVEWKPIPHTSTVTIEQIEKANEDLTYGKKQQKH